MPDLKLTEKFTVDAPVERVWKLLLNIQQLASFVPGARLDEHEGGSEAEELIRFSGVLTVQVGPLPIEFCGNATLSDLDYYEHSFKLEASAEDKAGEGAVTLSGSCKLLPINALGIEDPEEAEAAEQCAVSLEAEAELPGSMVFIDRTLLVEACKAVLTQLRDGVSARMAEAKAVLARETLRTELDELQNVLNESARELEALNRPPPPVQESAKNESETAPMEEAAWKNAAPKSVSQNKLAPAAGTPSPAMVLVDRARTRLREIYEMVRRFVAPRLRAFIDGPLRRLLRRSP